MDPHFAGCGLIDGETGRGVGEAVYEIAAEANHEAPFLSLFQARRDLAQRRRQLGVSACARGAGRLPASGLRIIRGLAGRRVVLGDRRLRAREGEPKALGASGLMFS
jgi:hypothetical protein